MPAARAHSATPSQTGASAAFPHRRIADGTAGSRFPRSLAVAVVLACGLVATAADARERRDGDVPGGERFGAESDTGFTGYPVDPGPAHSAYYDPSAQHRLYSPDWTGAFVGGGLLLGPAFSQHQAFGDMQPAFSSGLFLNVSSVQQIADVQLAWTQHRTQGPLDDTDAELGRHSIAGSVLVHPFFLMLLFGDRFAYTMAQLHALAGVSLDVVRLRESSDTTRRTGLGWHVGGGIDTYLARPRGRGSWWIGPQWRYQRVPGTFEDPRFTRAPIHEHHVWLRLSYRFHGNLLTGMRGPSVP